MLLALIVLLCWFVAEVFVAVKVAEAIGVIAMLVLLVVSWPAGSWALRSQGRAAWRRFADAINQRRPPGREAVDGTLVVLGGGLLIVPGFISDVVGVVLLLPPTRAVVRRLVLRNFRSRMLARAVRVTRPRRSYDVDSTAQDIKPPHLRP